MTNRLIKGLLLFAFFVMFCQGAAFAQGCFYYCTAYGYYDGSNVTGYVEYYDNSEDWYLGIDAAVEDTHGTYHYGACTGGEGYDYAIADCSYTPDGNGSWSIKGECYWWGEYWVYDGDTFYDVGVEVQPTGEDNNYYTTLPGDPIGAKFAATLQPTYFNFDELQTWETVTTVSDGCYDAYHQTAGPVSGSAAPPFYTTGNGYTDTITASAYYVSIYKAYTATYSGNCTWYTHQEMHYNSAGSYVAGTIGQYFSGYVKTFRRDADDYQY